MKKLLCVLLILTMMISLTACFKSAAVKEVEALIEEACDMPLEYLDEVDDAREAVQEAMEAYEDLSDKEKSQVENYGDLEEAYEDVFEAEYDFVINLLKFVNLNTDYVASGTDTVWSNVGASDFFTYYNCIFYFDDADKTLAGYTAEKGTDMEVLLWGAGYALCPEHTSGGKIKNESAIIEECAAFNLCFNNVETSLPDIEERVARMKKDYDDEYDNEMDIIHEWLIESSLYADLVLDPEGSLNSFRSAVSEFQENVARFAKNAEMQ